MLTGANYVVFSFCAVTRVSRSIQSKRTNWECKGNIFSARGPPALLLCS